MSCPLIIFAPQFSVHGTPTTYGSAPTKYPVQGVHILHDSDRVNIINGSGLSAPKKCAATGCGSTTGKGTTCYIQDGGQNGMHGTDMKRMTSQTNGGISVLGVIGLDDGW